MHRTTLIRGGGIFVASICCVLWLMPFFTRAASNEIAATVFSFPKACFCIIQDAAKIESLRKSAVAHCAKQYSTGVKQKLSAATCEFKGAEPSAASAILALELGKCIQFTCDKSVKENREQCIQEDTNTEINCNSDAKLGVVKDPSPAPSPAPSPGTTPSPQPQPSTPPAQPPPIQEAPGSSNPGGAFLPPEKTYDRQLNEAIAQAMGQSRVLSSMYERAYGGPTGGIDTPGNYSVTAIDVKRQDNSWWTTAMLSIFARNEAPQTTAETRKQNPTSVLETMSGTTPPSGHTFSEQQNEPVRGFAAQGQPRNPNAFPSVTSEDSRQSASSMERTTILSGEPAYSESPIHSGESVSNPSPQFSELDSHRKSFIGEFMHSLVTGISTALASIFAVFLALFNAILEFLQTILQTLGVR